MEYTGMEVAMELKGMEWIILEWKVMDMFDGATRISAVSAFQNRLIISAGSKYTSLLRYYRTLRSEQRYLVDSRH